MKLLLSHPMRNITQKTRTKDCSPAEVDRFKAHVKEYLLELFSLRYCLAKYLGRFTKCSCLNNLSTACCFDSLAARIGGFFNLVFVFCIITTNFYFYFLLVYFADQPLGIRQTILKERIRSAAVRKDECES